MPKEVQDDRSRPINSGGSSGPNCSAADHSNIAKNDGPNLFLGRLASEGKGHTFESCRVRQLFFILQRHMQTQPETSVVVHSRE
jgi:hypothetical protein